MYTEEEKERLKSALWFAVGKIADEEAMIRDRNATPQFVASLSEMLWVHLEDITKDLESFCSHAGRTTVRVDDVLLLARKNADLRDVMKGFVDGEKEAKEALKKRGKK